MSDLPNSKRVWNGRSLEEMVDEIISESPDLFEALATDDIRKIRRD